MKSKVWIGMVAVWMVFAAAMAAEARHFGPGFKDRGIGRDLVGLKALLELKLSDSQQEQMKNIISKYEDQREGLRDKMMEARKNIWTVLKAETFDEGNARNAFRAAAQVKEELFVLRAKMMSELKAVLTPEQLELVKERRAQRFERKRERLHGVAEKIGE